MNSIRRDLQAGVTVALIAIPQCMAFALIAGLAPINGIYAAIVMGLVGALVSSSPKLSIGPAVTTSTIVFSILATVAPGERQRWPELAGILTVLCGMMTLALAVAGVGQFVRYVSRTVLVGLMVGTAILIFGAQLGPSLGVPSSGQSTLIGILAETLGRFGEINWHAFAMSISVAILILLGARYAPTWPVPFVVLLASVLLQWTLEENGYAPRLRAVGDVPRTLPSGFPNLPLPPYSTDMLVGAAALSMIGIIQTLTLARAFADRDNARIDVKRELFALGAANLASGFLHGFAGAGSFARSALNDLAGANSRLAGIITAIAIGLIVYAAAPLVSHISHSATAGLLVATAATTVNWREFWQIMRHDRHDRAVLIVTLVGVFFLPIHWATLIGLAVSVAIFVRRASQLRIGEMVAGAGGHFHERRIDEHTGESAITMLQIEGPLFFAHADDLSDTLGRVFSRNPRVTIIRMRRTQQIDFSVIVALVRAVGPYAARGGTLILCGLQHDMRGLLLRGGLGRVVNSELMLTTTGTVFGSAHEAIAKAEHIAGPDTDGRPRFRTMPNAN
jgi:SulP family sulfate permease